MKIALILLLLIHHGVSLYDMSKEVVLTGTVKEWRWGNPHTWLSLESVSEGKVQIWEIEGAPPNWMTGQGWSNTSLKAGEKISIKMHPLKKQANGGILMEASRSDGSVLKVNRPASLGGP
jgi:hypothetical protein